jgi:CRP-like cAMP-binding protein
VKSVKSKTVSITVARLLPGQLVGEEEFVVNLRNRNYTLKSISGQSEVLKIDSSEYLKLLNERYDILRFISKRAKEKLKLNHRNFA